MIDVLIEQSGRIQTNRVLPPGGSRWFVVEEIGPCPVAPVERQWPGKFRPETVSVLRRTFELVYQRGNIRVWLEG